MLVNSKYANPLIVSQYTKIFFMSNCYKNNQNKQDLLLVSIRRQMLKSQTNIDIKVVGLVENWFDLTCESYPRTIYGSIKAIQSFLYDLPMADKISMYDSYMVSRKPVCTKLSALKALHDLLHTMPNMVITCFIFVAYMVISSFHTCFLHGYYMASICFFFMILVWYLVLASFSFFSCMSL